MATYAVGDIQGCFKTLQALVQEIGANPARDRLILVGDLVNRGPQSVEVMEFVFENRSWIDVLLGNHDLYALSRHFEKAEVKHLDTLEKLLKHARCDEWMNWLKEQPLLREEQGWTLVHAGLDPRWTLEEAKERALRAQTHISKRSPLKGDNKETVAVLTRTRAVDSQGERLKKFKSEPKEIPEGCHPWFSAPNRTWKGAKIVFGHWAALGVHNFETVWGIDSGCVWGGELSALRLEDEQVFSVPNSEAE